MVLAPIAFVPMDDRPVTAALPVMLGRIAGRSVDEPPREMLGRYLQPGAPDRITVWLNTQPPDTLDYVISSDMLAYGGLIASRTPANRFEDAAFRLRELQHLRSARPGAWIGVFGTVMRLAPTGVPASQSGFFGAYPAWLYLQQFANLHDPPGGEEVAEAQHLRQLIGEPTLDAYLQTRNRNYGIDTLLIGLAAHGTIDALVLGQDDAGPIGLHVREVRALLQAAQSEQGRTSIEPGADELGMALVARALARGAKWTPRIAVRYSRPDGASFSDPLEYAPVSAAIGGLIRLCGGVPDNVHPDVNLYVRVPHTSAGEDAALLRDIAAQEEARRSVALADLTFLTSYGDQAAFAERLLREGAAGALDAYASWNTNANTVGTAIAEAIAAGAGRRTGTYSQLAHKEFTFARFVDDYAFHDYVRPMLNGALDAQGVSDHTLLAADLAVPMSELDRSALWNRASSVLKQLYPGYHIASMNISLPWDRTFETQLDAAIAPNLEAAQ